MKKLFKIFFWLVGLVVILVIGAAVTIANLEPNDYREFISSKVRETTGRDFTLSGDLKLEYYPWLGLEIGGINMGNAPGFGDQPFLQTANLKLRVKLLPLLRKQVEMDTIQIHGARIHLARNKDGKTNWDDLVSGKPKKEAEPFPFAALILGGVDIQDAALTWDDRSADVSYRVSGLSATTGALVYGQPINLKIAMDAEASRPKLAMQFALDGTVAYDLDDQHYTLQPLQLSALMKGKNIPGGQTELKLVSAIDVNLDDDMATLSGIQFDMLDSHAEGDLTVNQLQSGKPAVKGKLDIKGKDLALLFKIAEVEPLATQVASLPDRGFAMTAQLLADMDRGDVDISELLVNLLGATVKGDIHARNIQSDTPGVKGKLDASGPDLPALVQIAGGFETGDDGNLKSLGRQLSSVKNKAFDVKAEFDADLKTGSVDIPVLVANLLDATIKANLQARNVQTESPAVKGKLNANGPDLPALIQIASLFEKQKDAGLKSLARQMAGMKDKAFDVAVEFDADLKAGKIEVPGLSMQALGMTVTGNLAGREAGSKATALQGKLNASGPDLPALIQIAAAFATGEDPLKAQGKQLAGLQNKAFDVKTEFDADLKAGNIEVRGLSMQTLGITVSGNLTGRQVQSEKPAVQGKLKATGPDLPLLLTLAGYFEKGEDPALGKLGKQLSSMANREFNVETNFDVDMKSGRINVPDLSARALGITVAGKLQGENIDSDRGKMEGQLQVAGTDLSGLLKALEQPELAEVLQKISVDAGVHGNRQDLSLNPLAIKATLSGKQIPNSPVDVSLNAATKVNLEKQTLVLDALTLSGLGLDVKGSLNAQKIIDAPVFDGTLAVSPFDLRQLLKQLNQKPPVTADPKVLGKVALQTSFSGTKTSIDLKKLALVLDETQLQGDLSVADFANPDIQFGIGIDKLNADRYLPPQEEGKKAKPATPEAAAAGAATELPLETLRALKVKGDLLIGELIISNARMKDVQFSIDARDGKIKLAPIVANLYEGKYTGDIYLDATGKLPKLTINTALKGIQAEPLLTDVTGKADLVGTGDFSVALIAAGRTTDGLKQTMTGQGGIRLEKGILRGVDVRKMLEQAEIMIESKRIGKIEKGGETPFDQLTGTLEITNGVINNQDLLLTAPGFKVPGKGMLINLNDMTWKYDMNVVVVESSAERGEEKYNIGGYEIPIKCRGKVDPNNCQPDFGGLLAAAGEKMVGEKLKDMLNKKLGVEKKPAAQPDATTTEPTGQPPAQQTTQQPPAQETQQPPAEQQPAKPADPVDAIKDKVGDEIGKGLEKLLKF